ncbi:MAG: hypothetical protein KJ760_04240 [Proteobacteria bacterium]|nr:hypothetical protein [Pseudomonadota bacterium]
MFKKMINLSNKAAIGFKYKWKDLEERSGDFWKIDVMMIGRVQMLLIVHEYTLFTMVRRKSTFQNLDSVANEIKKSCPWYRGSKSLSFGKNGN